MPRIITKLNLILGIAYWAAVLCPQPAVGQAPPAANGPSSSATQPTVVFFDDFIGPELNRSNWNVTITGQTVNGELVEVSGRIGVVVKRSLESGWIVRAG